MKYVVLIFFMICGLSLTAQDIHFSQFKNSKSSINPAYTGFHDSDHQAILQHRSQWSSISEPFKTISISYSHKKLYKNYSIGINIINDVAGLSNYKTNGLNLSSTLPLIDQKEQVLNVGFASGFFQRTYDVNSLLFLEDEQFASNNIFFMDLSFGGLYSKRINKISEIEIGMSAMHLNNPNQSFSETYSINTPIKYITHLIYDYYYNDLIFSPSFFFSRQAVEKELIYGVEIINKTNRFGSPLKLSTALFVRDKDALIPQLFVSYENISCYISYDINVSKLSKASNNYGGLELSILYNWNKKNKNQKNKFICPRYL